MLTLSAAVAAVAFSASGVLGQSQTVGSDGCLRLLGSVSCPGFQYAYINPSNLSNAWPWMAGITTVSQFDVAALNYFVDPFQFQQTKFVNQLGCTNASGVVIQYERTRLCSNWVNSVWGRECTARYNGTSAATSEKMMCQSTCLQYAASARSIVASPACPGADTTNGGRTTQLLKDYVDCTDWFTLATNNTDTCILGTQNEGNCGFGSSTSQLCGFCRGDNPDACCYQANTDVSVCGYSLPARPTTSTSASPSASASSSAAAVNAGSANGTQLSNGALAGAIVGSILGALLLIGLLILLLLCLRRRRRNKNRDSTSTFQAPQSLFSSTSPHPNASEKGLLPSGRAARSSPTMGGATTLYSGHTKSVESGNKLGQWPSPNMMSSTTVGSAGSGAAAGALAGAAAGAGLGPGFRSSGVVLPRVRDENQGGDRYIETGCEVTVLWPYTATLPDELDLRPGMKLRVLRLYDDAWGTGLVLEGGDANGDVGRQGAFPVVSTALAAIPEVLYVQETVWAGSEGS